MNPWHKGKKLAAGLLMAAFLTALALGSGTFLGKLYIKMIISKEEPLISTAEVPAAGAGQGEEPDLKLPPLPLYTAQVGAINLNEKDASDLLTKLQELGYSPYRTHSLPEKVLVGVFPQRRQAESITNLLIAQGFNARLTTLLINEKDNLAYSRQVKPLLLCYTQWLQETSLLWEVYQEEESYQELFLEALPLSYAAYDKIEEAQKKLESNQEPLKSAAASLKSATAEYMLALQILSKDWSKENYNLAQGTLLEVIDDYQILASQALQENQV